ncbi:hypothetical protein FH972_021433 [Carpinus fangiana]|uniref:Uncharacterized protein n=1 Tax=Carpinus fangiana TaxID=176857 RepID=A0A5N6KPW6_9ROSI|nr:hypothetical protein FH972_021433 [Carpinus fangiana]
MSSEAYDGADQCAALDTRNASPLVDLAGFWKGQAFGGIPGRATRLSPFSRRRGSSSSLTLPLPPLLSPTGRAIEDTSTATSTHPSPAHLHYAPTPVQATMRHAACSALSVAARRSLSSTTRCSATQQPFAPRTQPRPLSYAPHSPALPSEEQYNNDSLSPANPYGGAGNRLPPNYNSTARRITLAMVAAPILVVTSYFLWRRLVLGEERKRLVDANKSSSSGPSTGIVASRDSITQTRTEAANQTGPRAGI